MPDITLKIAELVALRAAFEPFPVLTTILDEQVELATHNVELTKNYNALVERVRRFEITDIHAAVVGGGISRAIRDNIEKIKINRIALNVLTDAEINGYRIQA